MKARSVYDLGCVPCGEFPSGIKPAGTVTDRPDAYKLVRAGVAEAVDDECREAANMTPAEWQAAYLAYPRTAAGIHPEDFAAWNEGRMRGYKPDGSFIPGPNADEDLDLAEDDDDDEWD